ncbi:CAP domain-containing protein [Streptomyces rhizosphaerihabitans]|uniref:CAP domain-containing protein n=1 Tax=Streptomyces rhizosphaerihabitans TaxID=1266770 RepID=UPI0021C20EDE|nr:CAP domain-containing protein [Streptomyces rhizosphaerihabitans]MCT9011149.1 CAP domain-containing protein [Streptomyces rhizosphaerihabitans]
MRNHPKHGRKTRRRPIVVAVLAMGAVAVPSAAMACMGDEGAEAITATSSGPWTDGKKTSWDGHRTDGKKTSWDGHRTDGRKTSWDRHRGRDVRTAKPTATASPSASPTTSPRTEAPAPEKPKAPVSKATTPPAPTRTTVAPKPTAVPPSTTAAPKPPTITAPAAGTATPAVARVVALVNSERAKVGCSPVALNAKLSQAAQAHSADMASHNTMSHTGSDGSDPGQRITRAGYLWSTYGENVAYGYSTPEQVMAGWMASAGHKRNILDCGFKEIGVGVAQPGNYWTQDFGTAR